MSEAAKEHLVQTWQTCLRATKWLRRSYAQCPAVPFKNLSDDEFDQLEALAARFARVTDLITQKLFRALDRYELEETGTLLDSANRAAKRGLIPSPDILRDLKDLRNEIVHEYALDDLPRLFEEIHGATPRLLSLIEAIEYYLADRHQLR